MKHYRRILLIAALLCAAAFGGFLANASGSKAVQAAPLAAFGPGTKLTLLDVPNLSTDPDEFGASAVKIGDVGSFTVENSASLVEVTYQGHLMVHAITGTGVFFELRVDDTNGLLINLGQPSGMAMVLNSEAGFGEFVFRNFSGYWRDLTPGEHTVSVWARTVSAAGTGDNAIIRPNGWDSTIVTVKEILPFGTTMLPVIER